MVTTCFMVMVDTGWIFTLRPILYECSEGGAGEGCSGREEEVGGRVVALG